MAYVFFLVIPDVHIDIDISWGHRRPSRVVGGLGTEAATLRGHATVSDPSSG